MFEQNITTYGGNIEATQHAITAATKYKTTIFQNQEIFFLKTFDFISK